MGAVERLQGEVGFKNLKGGYLHQYKSHPIYGIGIPGLNKQWHCRGLVFDPEDQVTEIKRLECGELTFATKRQAEDHGLDVCKKWLDDQSEASVSSSPTASLPAKTGALAL